MSNVAVVFHDALGASLSFPYEDAPGLEVDGHVGSSQCPHAMETPDDHWLHMFSAAGQNGVLSGNVWKRGGWELTSLAHDLAFHSLSQ